MAPMNISIYGNGSEEIRTLEDWKAYASTEGKWEDEYSAKELARLWLEGQGADAVIDLLQPVLPELTLSKATAEAKTAFDSYPGGVRNHDVLAFGSADIGPVVIGIEGKVNEALGATIEARYEEAAATKQRGDNTNLDLRVDGLLTSLAGRSLAEDPRLGGLRYQLFSALAGTLAAANEETKAVAVVVHLIETPVADPRKFEQTRRAVADFASVVLGDDNFSDLGGPYEASNSTDAYRSDLPIWLGVIRTGPAAD